jgi:hypothetical protein
METRHVTALADEASRYLEAVDLSRALGGRVRWRSEAMEIGRDRVRPSAAGATCIRCAGPLARINGRHVCLGP